MIVKLTGFRTERLCRRFVCVSDRSIGACRAFEVVAAGRELAVAEAGRELAFAAAGRGIRDLFADRAGMSSIQ